MNTTKPFISLATQTLLILNRLRVEQQLRQEQPDGEQKQAGKSERDTNQERAHKAEGREVVIGKSPARTWNGGVRQSARGSLLTTGGFRPSAASVPNGAQSFLPGALRRPEVSGTGGCRRKLNDVAVPC